VMHARDTLRVLLVNAPFGLIEFPHLGTSLIKAATHQAGFACDVLYASVEFARRIGFTEYLSVERAACPILLPERPFARLLSEDIPSIDDFYREIVQPFSDRLFPFIQQSDVQNRIGRESMERIEECATTFTEELVDRPELGDYDVIAFSSSYGQHVASLAIAKRIKRRHPRTIIAFGGANCEGIMGKQLVRSFPFVDYAFSGDGDVSFPLFLAAMRDGRTVDLPGVFHRDTLADDDTDLRPPLTRVHLDELPYPDFEDYFAAIRRPPDASRYCIGIPVEGSRGCWWGEKHHCTFCGLNGLTMRYRTKSPARFAAELRHLIERYGHADVMATDNIMDWKAFGDLLPALKAERSHNVLFFEIKANVKKAQVEALADAGITHVQPGIESLSTHGLMLMDKGTTSLDNLQLLKWAEEYGITLTWNVLCGIPGETQEDYDEMEILMGKVPHLQPPSAFVRVSIDRFSPYFNTPAKYGLEIAPSIAYRYVYDLPPEDIANIAYWYYYRNTNGSSRTSLEPPSYSKRALRLRAIWQRLYGKVQFHYTVEEDGRVRLEDTRPLAAQHERRLDPLASRIFLLADSVISRQALERRLGENGNGVRFTSADIDAALAELEAQSVIHRDGDRYVALATSAACRPKGPALGDTVVNTL
jgi:ribosomal peptide maturation radical SAM protein 1